MAKHKHLTIDERYKIQHGLDAGKSFKQIGADIERDCTTISKEVRLRRFFKQTGAYGSPFNDCLSYWDCLENNLCAGAACRGKLCKRCTKLPCRKQCGAYAKKICTLREKPPYVCNSCATRNRCTLEKALYSARSAQGDYAAVLTESRSGICASEEEIVRLDNILSPRIKKGQSIYSIMDDCGDKIMWSGKTIYKYVGLSLFDARNLDLPRKVRFRPRKSKHESLKVDKLCRLGRTYEDYKAFLSENPDTHVVEMDTVHGRRGGKALLTIHFVAAHFMLAYLLDDLTSSSVTGTFLSIRNLLGPDLYSSLFFVLLGDNGPEFSNPKAIECDASGQKLCSVFYCDPMQSQQKGALENNNSMIRRIIPKGEPMEKYSQQDISLMMDHINSYGRKSLNGRSPYSMFEFIYGTEPLKKLGANLVPPDMVTLRPALINRG